jgi:hypothetical protein
MCSKILRIGRGTREFCFPAPQCSCELQRGSQRHTRVKRPDIFEPEPMAEAKTVTDKILSFQIQTKQSGLRK